MTFAHLARAVRDELGQEHRYAHVVRVARLAGRLASRHRETTANARLAGMLHDLARLYSPSRLLDECVRRGLPVDAFERANPVVLHARVGAEIARERFGVRDEAVLSAIRTHTLGAADMSRLDKVVYVADSVEPGRDFAGRARLEALAFEDLDAGTLAVLRESVNYIAARGGKPAPQTIAAIAALDRPAHAAPSERRPSCPT